jgi:hypothetical protein
MRSSCSRHWLRLGKAAAALLALPPLLLLLPLLPGVVLELLVALRLLLLSLLDVERPSSSGWLMY